MKISVEIPSGAEHNLTIRGAVETDLDTRQWSKGFYRMIDGGDVAVVAESGGEYRWAYFNLAYDHPGTSKEGVNIGQIRPFMKLPVGSKVIVEFEVKE